MVITYRACTLCSYRLVLLFLVASLALVSACGGGSSNATPLNDLESGVALESSSYLLFITRKGELNKISATTGNSRLLHTFDGLNMIGPPDVIGETAYVTADDNSMNAIDVNTGELLWDAPLGEYKERLARPTPVVCDETVCFAMGNTGLLYAIDTKQRRVKWQVALHPNGDSGEELWGTALLVSGDKIYLGANRPDSYAVTPVSPRLFVVDRESGALLQEVLYDAPLLGPPAIAGDVLIVSTSGGMQVLDRHSLNVNWQVQGPAFTTALVLGESVIVGQIDRNKTYTTDEFATVSFALDNGDLQWVVDGGSDDFLYTPTTDGQVVYTAKNGRFICQACPNADALTVDPASGKVLRELDLSISYTPLAAFGSLFYDDVFYDDNGDYDRLQGFVSIDAATGSLNWINTDSDLHSGSSGYVLVQDGVVHGRTAFPDVQN